MSYLDFVFDLQRFAEVTVDLTKAKSFLTGSTAGTKYIGANGEVYDTAEAAVAAETTVVATARVEGEAQTVTKSLDITAAADTEVTLSGMTADDLAGVTVATSTSCKFSLAETTGSITAKSLTFTSKGIVADASVGVAVTSAGVVSGLAADATFTVYDSIGDTLGTVYKAVSTTVEETTTNTLQVSGDQVGIYSVTDFSNVTVTLASGADTVAEGETTKTPATALTLTLATGGSADTAYVGVYLKDGEYQVSSANVEDGTVVGYFAVKTETNFGDPVATVSFVGADKTTASQLLGTVTVDAEALTAVGGTDLTQLTITTGIATGLVTVNNVASTADVVVGGATYQKDVTAAETESVAAVSYTKTYSLGAANTITLPEATAAGEYKFAVTNELGDHGKYTTSIATESSATQTGAYFLVAVTAGESSALTYTVSYVPGDSNHPTAAEMTDSSWANIVVNAGSVAKGNTVTVTDIGGSTADKFTVNAPYGVVVTPVEDVVTVSRTGNQTFTLTETNKVTLAKSSIAYYTVTSTDTDNDGNPTITITKVDGSTAPTEGSFFTVDATSTSGKCKVTYTDGAGISLSGLKDSDGNAIQITLALPTGEGTTLDNTVEVDITDTDNAVDYKIDGLPAGTKVTGAVEGSDSVTYASGIYNNVTLKLTDLITEDGTVYYSVVEDTSTDNDTSTGYKYYKLGAKITTEEGAAPANTNNYFTIVKSGTTYTVSYTKAASGTAIDLATATGGKTTIDAAGITSADTLIQIVNGTGAAQTVNDYAVTGVISGGYTGTDAAGIKVGTFTTEDEATTFTGTDLADAKITYNTSYALNSEKKTITLSSSDTYWKVTATTSKGVVTYGVETLASLEDNTASYIQATWDEGKTTATLKFVQGSAEDAVTEADFAANITDAITVNASALSSVNTLTTIVLTSDTTAADQTVTGIEYKVTNVPAGVEVTNVTSGSDTVEYENTFTLSTEANTLTLGKTAGTVYYEVTGTEDKGAYTCKIGSAIDVSEMTDEEKTAALAKKNYFTVTTESEGNVSITYTQAGSGEGADKAYDLDNNTVVVDASGAASTATITVGSNGDDSITYKASDLSKGQTLTKATAGTGETINAVVSSTYATTYELSFQSGTGLTATDSENNVAGGFALQGESAKGNTYYYTVTRGTQSATGVYTYTVAAYTATEANPAPASGTAYFAVSYASTGLLASVTYVNGAGSDYDLTGKGLKVNVDASGLASTVVELDITDTDNVVDYAITGVGESVSVTGAGDGDTYVKSGGTIALTGEITLSEAETAYYVVNSADGAYTLATATATKPGTGDNYVTVTKSGDNYTLSYTAASTGTAYTLGTSGDGITVKADGLEAGTITNSTGGKVAVTGATPETQISGSNTSISYVTGFAWADATTDGTYTYYLAAEAADAVDTSAEAGTTAAGGTYIKAVVTVADGVYKVTNDKKLYTANSSTGALTAGDANSYTGSITVTAPATAVKLDGTDFAGAALTGVAADSVLTSIPTTVAVTTAELDKGESFKIGDTTYTAGADDTAISVTGSKIVSGILSLTEAGGTLAGSSDAQNVTLNSGNGVVVTYASGAVTSVTGVDSAGEIVTVGTTSYIYQAIDNVNYIRKFDGTNSYYAAASTGDVTHLDYYLGESTKAAPTVYAGGFAWDNTANVGNGAGVFYMSTGDGVKTGTEAAAIGTSGTYVKAVVTGSSGTKALALSIVESNSAGLPQTVTNYSLSAPIAVAGGDSAISYSKGAEDTFALAITGVAANSSLTVAEGDTIETAALANGAKVTVNSVDYVSSVADGGEAQQLTFSSNALQEGTITISGNGAVLADGSAITYDGDVSDSTQATGTAVITVADGKVTSITGLGTDEAITFTTSTTETTYQSDASDGTKVTKTVKTLATGEITSTVITLTAADGDVLAGTTGDATYSYTNSLAWNSTASDGTMGYYKATYNSESGKYTATVTAAGSGTMANGEVFVKAALTPVLKEDNTLDHTVLKLTPGTIAGGVFTEDTSGVLNGAEIAVTVTDSVAVTYDNASAAYNVTISGAGAGSVLTLRKGDTVTTASLSADDTLSVNGQTFKAAASGGLSLYAAGKTAADVQVVSGSLYVTGEISSVNGTTVANTVAYTAGTATGSDDGVKVAFASGGAVSTITDLDAGETVTVTAASGITTTYTAHATDSTIVYKTITGDTTEGSSNTNGTYVTTITSGADVVAGGTDANAYAAVVSNDYTFSWGTATTADSPAYFLADGGAVTVTGGTVTIDHTKYGTALVKASLTEAGVLTLTKSTIGKTGAVTDSTGDIDAATNVTLSGLEGKTITYAKPDSITGTLTVSGAGTGSVFTGLDAGDTVTTSSLTAGTGTVSVNGHLYTAGAAGTLTIDGSGNATTGVFKLVTATDSNQANTLAALNTAEDVTELEASDTVSTAATVTYTGTDANGAIVTVADGLVSSITGLGAGEKVTFQEVETTKAGTASTVTTTYAAETSGSVIKVTKTVNDNGVTSIYTQTFPNDAQDVMKTTGWTVSSQTTTTKFDFGATSDGSVGYFAAATDSDGSYVLKTGTVTTQSSSEITGAATDKYYVRVTASQDATGAITLSSMELVHLESTGAWTAVTGKSLGTIGLTAPAGATVKLTEENRSYALAITATKGTITGTQAGDVITGTMAAANDVLKVGSTAYTSAAASNAIEINGDGTVVKGAFTVKDDTLTAAGVTETDGTVTTASAKVSYSTTGTTDATKNGAKVTFAEGAVTTVEDLDAGETITIVQGTATTTYTATSGTAVTKTVADSAAGTTETFTATITADDDVVGATYSVSSAFDWGATDAGKVGYFQYDTSTGTVTIAPQTATAVTPADTKSIVRISVSGDATKGYTIDSLTISQDAAGTDVTGTSTAAITITAPGSLTMADTATRAYTLAITGAASGQSFSGLADSDTVTTGSLAAGSAVTVNGTEYTNAILSAMVINGNGTAKSGQFTLDKNHSIALSSGGTTTLVAYTKGDGAQVNVANNVVKTITKLDGGDTITVTATDANGVVTTTTYAGTAQKDGTILVTKTVVADGATSVYTMTAESNGENIADASAYTAADSGNVIKGQLKWTENSTGYFLADDVTTDSEGTVTALGEVTAKAETKATSITSTQAGNVYVKVSVVYDEDTDTATIGSIAPYMVSATGTLEAVSGTGLGTVNITAPTGTKLVLTDVTDAVAVNVTGAAAGSAITLEAGDSLTTATLAAGETVTVNNTTYTAGGSSALKFADAGVLVNGIVRMTADAYAVSTSTSGTVVYTKSTAATSGSTAPVVTVVNGVVTGVSGLTVATSETVVATDANGAVVTYSLDSNSVMNAAVTGTTTGSVTIAALAEGATVSVGTTTYTSGAANNSIKLYNGTLKDGVVKLTTNNSEITAAGTDNTVTTDDVTVKFTKASTLGVAVVTVASGQVTSIKGLLAGDSVKVTQKNAGTKTDGDGNVTPVDIETTYALDATGTTVTKTVKQDGSDDVITTAYIAAGGELTSASYFGDDTTSLTGQFNWNIEDISGRNIGYFKITENAKTEVKTATIADQAQEVSATTTKGKTTKYVVANVNADANGNSELSLSGIQVANDGTDTTITALAATAFTAADKLTITAPTDRGITYNKGTAAFAVAINKVAADSVFTGLDTGDTITTGTLAENAIISVDGVNYVAGAKGVLSFVGEGDATTATNQIALLSGTIALTSGTEYRLSGAKAAADEGSVTNDILVSSTATGVVVKAANGVVTSIKGLTGLNNTVQVVQGTEVTVYTALDAAGTMISKAVSTWTDTATNPGVVDAAELSGTVTQYLTVASGGEIYSGKYKAAETYAGNALSFAAPETGTNTTYGYVALGADTTADKSIGAAGSAAAGDLITTAAIAPTPGSYYLRVTAATTAAGITTIKGVDLMQAGATGALTAVKSSVASYSGTLTINGQTSAAGAETTTYATFNYTLPAASKRDWKLAVTNAALGSTFTNLGAEDLVTSADNAAYELGSGKTVTVYGKNTTTNTQQTTKVTTKGDGVILTVANGDLTAVNGFASKSGETLTVTVTDPEDGLLTYSYKATVKSGQVTLTRTATDNAGNTSTATATMSEAEAATLVLTANGAATYKVGGTAAAATNLTWTTTAADRTVVADFDWTMSKASTGYFAVKNSAATVTKAKTTITARNASTSYIAVTISADGTVDSIKQMQFDTTTAADANNADVTNMKATTSAFSGKLTLTAPTAAALILDRTAALTDASVDADNVTLVVNGAITGSTISNLVNGDTVTTAKLAASTGSVTVNGHVYTAGVAGALKFEVQDNTDTLVSGTALLNSTAGTDTVGKDMLYINNGTENVAIQALSGDITVKAVTSKGATTYTIADLDENEQFSVGEVTYRKSASTLFREVDGQITGIYTGTNVKSIATADLTNAKKWNEVTATVSEDGTTVYKQVNVNLAAVDSRYKTDLRAATGDYNYDVVMDAYVKSGTNTSKTALTASVVAAADDSGLQSNLGAANAVAKTYDASASAVAQTITATAGWTVTGSQYDDTITSAASGNVSISGGAGNDFITLKNGAAETVTVNNGDGLDTVSGYAAKDAIQLADENFLIELGADSKYKGDVYLYYENDGTEGASDGDNGVLLKAVSGKAVTVNGKTYYFGNDYTKTTGATFTYAETAYYYGNSSGKNTLKVATDKNKATAKTLGDDVVVDLTATDDNGRSIYTNIQNVNAASSTNRVVLTAAATGSTLTGGTYQSTLKSGAGSDTLVGGSGQDMFYFDDVNGNDTVSKYTSSKDAVYVGGTSDLTNGYTVSASGSNVVIKKGGDATSGITITGAVNAAKAVTISTDGKIDGSSVDYYVGKATTANKFTKFDGDAYYVGGAKDDTIQLAKGDLGAAVDMTTSKYQSIEIIDATALSGGKNATAGTTAGVTVTTGTSDVTVKGSIYADTVNTTAGEATILYSAVKYANGDTVTGFGVDDVIQINGLKEVTITASTTEANTYTITGTGLSMKVTTTGAALTQSTVNKKNVQIKLADS